MRIFPVVLMLVLFSGSICAQSLLSGSFGRILVPINNQIGLYLANRYNAQLSLTMPRNQNVENVIEQAEMSVVSAALSRFLIENVASFEPHQSDEIARNHQLLAAYLQSMRDMDMLPLSDQDAQMYYQIMAMVWAADQQHASKTKGSVLKRFDPEFWKNNRRGGRGPGPGSAVH